MITVATLLTWASLSLMPLPATINVQVGSCPGMEKVASACATSPDQVIYFDAEFYERYGDERSTRRP